MSLRRLATSLGSAIAFLLAIGPLSAPLRANMAVSRAQAALTVSDPVTAEDELVKAIELQPRFGYYAESLAYLYGQGGFFEFAFLEMDRAARLQPGIPYLALKAANAALEADRLDAAEYWYERAIKADPNGSIVLKEAAGFFSQIGDAKHAGELMSHVESLEPFRSVQ